MFFLKNIYKIIKKVYRRLLNISLSRQVNNLSIHYLKIKMSQHGRHGQRTMQRININMRQVIAHIWCTRKKSVYIKKTNLQNKFRKYVCAHAFKPWYFCFPSSFLIWCQLKINERRQINQEHRASYSMMKHHVITNLISYKITRINTDQEYHKFKD